MLLFYEKSYISSQFSYIFTEKRKILAKNRIFYQAFSPKNQTFWRKIEHFLRKKKHFIGPFHRKIEYFANSETFLSAQFPRKSEILEENVNSWRFNFPTFLQKMKDYFLCKKRMNFLLHFLLTLSYSYFHSSYLRSHVW